MKNLFYTSFALFVVWVPVIVADRCDNVTVSERDVFKHVFENYNKIARPRKNVSDILEITISFRLASIRSFVSGTWYHCGTMRT